jgi:hypothetical protein
MNLKQYFDENFGTGVMATADKDGTVDAAIYSRPHVFEDGTVAFLLILANFTPMSKAF